MTQTPSNMIITPTDVDTYLACFDWNPAFGSPRGAPDDPPSPTGHGTTEIDAMIDLFSEAMQYPEWCLNSEEQFQSMSLDDCDSDVQKQHSFVIGFIAGMRAMQPDDIESVPVP